MASTPSTPAATPVAADVAKKAQQELTKAIKAARTEYSAAVSAAKVTRDTKVAAAYAEFATVTTPAA